MFKGNYYIYTRCSTEEQGKKGFSHQYQVSTIRQHMTNYNAVELGVYSDTISGTILDRPSLSDLYEICKESNGVVDYVVVQKFDRLGRNAEKCLMWVRMFREIGVEVNSPFEFIDFKSSDWPVLLSLRFAIAQTESIKISERTRDGINQSLRSGYWTATAPYGYVRKDTDEMKSSGSRRRIMTLDPKASKDVRRMFDRFILGETKSDIYLDYGFMSRSKFYGIFENSLLYAGYYFAKAYRGFKKELIKGKHAPLITFKEHEEIESRMKKYSGTKNVVFSQLTGGEKAFYLKGLLKSDTGENLTGSYSKGRKKYYGYYHTVGKNRVHHPIAKTHTLVERVMNEVSCSLDDADVAYVVHLIKDSLKPQKEILESLEQQIDVINDRIARIKNDYLDGNLSNEDLKSFQADLDKQKLELKQNYIDGSKKIEHLNQIVRTAFPRLIDVGLVYSQSTAYDRRAILKMVFPEGFSVVKGEDGVRTTYVNSFYNIKSYDSGSYELIKIKKGLEINQIPLGVDSPDGFESKLRYVDDLIKAYNLFKRISKI